MKRLLVRDSITTLGVINGVLLQSFEWYLPNDSQHYNRLSKQVNHLKEIGVSAVWLPPVSKGAAGIKDVGYGIYDAYDLGEFNQKGNISTKYGTKNDLIDFCNIINSNQIDIYGDMVFNHRIEGDNIEKFNVIKVDPNNRLKDISSSYDASAYTHFSFNKRNKLYSKFEYHSYHFTGIDVNLLNNEHAVHRILGENKYWSSFVDKEYGNYDYLLGYDLDLQHPEVQKELIDYSLWIRQTLNLKGFRYDAVKHMHLPFINQVTNTHLNKDHNTFFMAEYWSGDFNILTKFLKDTDYKVHLFDVPLHFKFFAASQQKQNFDLRTIFDNTLVKSNPTLAVTFVDNHDTQIGQSLQSWVETWFKHHAYALILLREAGYPTLFYGDYYGIVGGPGPFPGLKDSLRKILLARKYSSYGSQIDYFDHPNTIGWIRFNSVTCLAVILSNGNDGYKVMSFGSTYKNFDMVDIMDNNNQVKLDNTGQATFNVKSKKVAIFVLKSELSKYQ